MEIEGYVYYSGYGYDDDGHTDDYDLMFESLDGKIQLMLNDLEGAIFPEAKANNGAWMSPISVHGKMKGKLTIKFEKELVIEGAII